MNQNNYNKSVAVDLDDTICDTARIIVKYAKVFHKKVLRRKYKKIKLNNVDDYFYFALELGWDKDDVTRFFDYYYPEYLKFVKPVKHAKKAINYLKKIGFDVHIISARHLSSKEDVYNLTVMWLRKYGIPFDSLNIGEKDKTNFVKKYQCGLFIDDSYKNCTEIQNRLQITSVLFLTKYNKKFINLDVKSILSWKDLLKHGGVK